MQPLSPRLPRRPSRGPVPAEPRLRPRGALLRWPEGQALRRAELARAAAVEEEEEEAGEEREREDGADDGAGDLARVRRVPGGAGSKNVISWKG
jgi:hypothetical protein